MSMFSGLSFILPFQGFGIQPNIFHKNITEYYLRALSNAFMYYGIDPLMLVSKLGTCFSLGFFNIMFVLSNNISRQK